MKTKIYKISFMLSADDFKILESLASDNGCVKSDVIRQGISYYKFFNDALKNGSTVLVEDKNGNVSKVTIM